ncbi:2Fe-2S iron-sulfur cluster-binding protein [Paraburkholderia sp. USG1]|uniref:2Fe-2S iron-sulfur cluster-binding protein n=1 Tax=Paraburkholderia sp. USG1 TaxID=2952268 RepID=UPI0028545872|nr:2Fe-2S iron-sulfur cluster-binding protein [Paraburkholderia sp. USG1]MDR8394734.1 2Fe-2S iron-sulfur cluster-binding protein [Paraburkholderia sp. USG1]
MPTVTYVEHNGTAHTVEAKPGRSLMQIAVDNRVSGILGDCGGSCSCATCHGYIDRKWADRLPPVSETESFMLETVPELREGSRLCCQIRMSPELDGIVVTLPEDQG